MYLRVSTVLSSQSVDKHLPEIKMKVFICVCFLAVFAAALARPDDEKYTDKYDNVDVDEILSNERLLQAHVDCVMETGKCTSEGKELKSHITDALENECSKCNEKQKEGVKKVIRHLVNKEPEIWEKLTAKYDPESKYKSKYEKELKEIKA